MPDKAVGRAELDTDGRFVEMDEAFVDLIGAPAGFLCGRALEEAVHFIDIDQGHPPLDTPWVAEVRPLAQRHRWLRLAGADRRGEGIGVTAEDITSERRGQIFRSVSMEISELIADGLRVNVEERLSAALREVLAFDRLRLLRLESVTNRVTVIMTSEGQAGSVGFGPAGQRFPDDESTVALVWDQTVIGSVGDGSRAVVIRDLTALEDPPDEVALLVNEGFRSLIGIPVRISRRPVGALVIERKEPGDFAPSEVEMLTDLSALFSVALDRIRLERAAVDSASVYATVFETAGEGILLSDVETGRIEAVNSRYLELTGYRRRKLLDTMRIQDIDPSEPENALDRARMIKSQSGPVTTHHIKRSGRRLPVEITRRMFTWRGKLTELLVVRDVRERLKQEQQIRRLAIAVEAVSLGVLLTSADGTVVFANPALERMLGVEPDALGGRQLDELRGLDTDQDFEGEIHITPIDGTRFPAYISRALFASRAGAPAGAVEIWTDLTEQKERDQLLMQADKLASLGQTAASVAHEINNPLAFIIANLRTLLEYATDVRQAFRDIALTAPTSDTPQQKLQEVHDIISDPELMETVEDMEQLTTESLRGAERVRTIVADLRAYARRRDIMQPCSLEQIIANTLTLAKNEIKYRAEVVTEFAEDLPRVIGSPGRLEQVVLNLILNAAQSLPQEPGDSRENKITIRLFAQEDHVICEIEDTGIGIPADLRDKIFNQFFTTKDTKRGTGLGLFISKKIVDNHGGRLEVESEVGRGSTFRLVVPAEPQDSGDVTTSRPPKRSRILLIDDEEMVLESLTRVLSRHHDVVTAQSGQVGLLKATSAEFDVVLCDLGLEDLPGDELFEKLREHRPDITDRFVIISGGALSPEAASIESRQVHRLVKPIPPERLLALIAKIVRDTDVES